jgi:hypothetical protein
MAQKLMSFLLKNKIKENGSDLVKKPTRDRREDDQLIQVSVK